jgi:hypothetical protein
MRGPQLRDAEVPAQPPSLATMADGVRRLGTPFPSVGASCLGRNVSALIVETAWNADRPLLLAKP